jgi:diguanylate cyclase (GGDEF)-like protein
MQVGSRSGAPPVFERRAKQRGRTLLGGKIVFNGGRSAIDCVIRNISEDGACAQVESPVGIPEQVLLTITGESEVRSCVVAWQSANRLGLTFRHAGVAEDPQAELPALASAPEIMRGEMLALRAALDEVRFGVLLLDSELRALFINRAFRKMWRLPDGKADAKPPFVALMYHGRDTRAYKVPDEDLDDYIADRVARVRAGDPTPLDLRLANGEIIRLQCAVLPNGGRMLSYTYVTDIVRQADQLKVLKAALDGTEEGIIVLDADLNAQFMNRSVRSLMQVPEELADSRPSYATLVAEARRTGTFDSPPEKLDALLARRIELVRSGDPTPHDLRMKDGRHIRSRCATLPSGSRMLTYWDVTDLIRNAEQLEQLASFDTMTGLFNRRHFLALAEAEWDRFQRYHRSLTMLKLDIDHFKRVNDRYGHAIGDDVIRSIARECLDSKRGPDLVGRVGGEEFALLLPETDLVQAGVVAERIRSNVGAQTIANPRGGFRVTVSIGMAPATLSMSGIHALMHAADRALHRAKEMGRNRVVEFDPVAQTGSKLAAE